MNFGRFYPVDSFWRQRDPRVKMIILLILVIFIFLEQNIVGQIMAFSICTLLFFTANVPFIIPLKVLYSFRWLLGLTFFVNLLFTSGGTRLSGLPFTGSAVVLSLLYFGRLVTLILLGTWLMNTTEPLILIKGLEEFLIPFKGFAPVGEIAFVLGLSFQFFPLLMEEAEEITMAQRARGVTFQGNLWQRKAKGLISMVVPLFHSTLRRSYELAQAMEARGFIPGANRSSLSELTWNRKDTFVLILLISLLTGWFLVEKGLI